MNSKHVVGLIGAGGVTQNHLRACRELESVETRWVCDINLEAAKGRAAEFNIPRVTTDMREVFADKDVDVVIICLPTFLHKDTTIAAAKAGKNVLCEKPVAMNVTEADEMIAACRSAGVKLAVGHNYRHKPYYQVMRDAVRSGRLGENVSIRTFATSPTQMKPDTAPADTRNWRAFAEKGGGWIMDGFIHHVDFVCWTLGEIDWISAVHPPRDGALSGTCTALVSFKNGSHFNHSQLEVAKGVKGELETRIIGSRGQLTQRSRTKPDGSSEDYFEIVTWDAAGQITRDEANFPPYYHADCFRQEMDAQLRDFLRAIETNTDPLVTGEQAREALRICRCIFDADQHGRIERA